MEKFQWGSEAKAPESKPSKTSKFLWGSESGSTLDNNLADLKNSVSNFVDDPAKNNLVSQLNSVGTSDVQIPVRDDLSDSQIVGRGLVRQALGPVGNLISPSSQPDSPVGAFSDKYMQQLPLNLGDEFRAGADTLGDALTDNINPKGNAIDQYVENRDLIRAQLQAQGEKYPRASGLGTLAAVISQAPLVKGESPKSLISSSAGLGGMNTLGYSNKELDDPSLYSDVGRNAAVGGLLGAAGSGLPALGRMANPKFDPNSLIFRIASGKGTSAPKKFTTPDGDNSLSPAAQGLLEAQKRGLFELKSNPLTNSQEIVAKGDGSLKSLFGGSNLQLLKKNVDEELSNMTEGSKQYNQLQDFNKAIDSGLSNSSYKSAKEGQSGMLGSLFDTVTKSKGTGSISDMAGSLIKNVGEPAIAAGINLMGAPTRIPSINAWAATVLPSYKDGKITNQQSLEIANHYIDRNQTKDTVTKAREKQLLNNQGYFDPDNIPKDIKQESINRLNGGQ